MWYIHSTNVHYMVVTDCKFRLLLYPPNHQSMQHEADERTVQMSDDTGRPTSHLAIARFFARLNDTLTRFWKISKHWLHTLADCLSRPFTSDIIRLLNKYAV